MKKRSIKDMRRDELMNAAIEAVGSEGLRRATVAMIANRAGMSPGMVIHYFKTKEDLLVSALGSLAIQYRSNITGCLPPNPTPRDRLKAMIDGSFLPGHFSGAKRQAWVQFKLASQNEPNIKYLYNLIGVRFVSNLKYAVRPLVAEGEIDDVVDGISAIIDGFFWEMNGEFEEADFIRAKRICWDYVCRRIPNIRDAD